MNISRDVKFTIKKKENDSKSNKIIFYSKKYLNYFLESKVKFSKC